MDEGFSKLKDRFFEGLPESNARKRMVFVNRLREMFITQLSYILMKTAGSVNSLVAICLRRFSIQKEK